MSYKLGLLLIFTCIVQLYGHQQKFNCIYECIKLYNSNNLYRNIFGDNFVGIYYKPLIQKYLNNMNFLHIHKCGEIF